MNDREYPAAPRRKRAVWAWIIILFALPLSGVAAQAPSLIHGLWVWKTETVLEVPRGAETLRDFCQSNGINEVYVSISARSPTLNLDALVHLIDLLHQPSIQVDALLSSVDADEPGKGRDKLLGQVREILNFNRQHPAQRFDGIHLDIEPQQRLENKGAGNLRFLPGLTDAFRDVRELAEPAGITVDADIQDKLLKGDLDQRRMLLSSIPRLTLMMYELNHPGDGASDEQKAQKAVSKSQMYLQLAFEGLDDANLARIAIALRTPDYGDSLPQVLKKLNESNIGNSHYLGWGWHSYNDELKPVQ